MVQQPAYPNDETIHCGRFVDSIIARLYRRPSACYVKCLEPSLIKNTVIEPGEGLSSAASLAPAANMSYVFHPTHARLLCAPCGMLSREVLIWPTL